MASEPLGGRFAKLWAASTTSALGSGLATIAAPLFVAAHTKSPLIVSATFGVAWLPWLLFALPGGVLVDRVDRRRLMITIDWTRTAAMGVLAVALLAGWAGIALLDAVLFVVNVDEGSDEVPAAIAAYAAEQGAAAVAISARLEAELSELDAGEAAAMRADLGLSESGLQRVIRGAFALLELVAFFTAGEDKPAQSWHLRRGLSVWHAAGMIHSDIQRGFVRAEVVPWSELVDAGGYAGARERGTLRLGTFGLEGKP